MQETRSALRAVRAAEPSPYTRNPDHLGRPANGVWVETPEVGDVFDFIYTRGSRAMRRRRLLVLELVYSDQNNQTIGFRGYDYAMEAPRTYMFSGVQYGGYIVPRPPNPPGARIPSDATL
eukprot:4107471-Alexandrium_andersonii.AAC.1